MVEKSHPKTHAEESFHSLLDTVFVWVKCALLCMKMLIYLTLSFILGCLKTIPMALWKGSGQRQEIGKQGKHGTNTYPHRNQHTDTHCMAIGWIHSQQQQASRH